MGSSNKVFKSFFPGRRTVLDTALKNIDKNTCNQLLLAHRKYRKSQTLPEQMITYAKSNVIDTFKKINETPTQNTSQQLKYLMTTFDCKKDFFSLLNCVSEQKKQELCLVENRAMMECLQRPVKDMTMIAWNM